MDGDEQARADTKIGFDALQERIEAAGFRRSVAVADWMPLLSALYGCQTRRKRGIVVSGRAGCGKTQFLRAVLSVFRSSSMWIPCYDVQSLEWLDWKESMAMLRNKSFLLLDDFGTDEPVNVYGTKNDRVARLIMEWADWPKRFAKPMPMMLLATNLTSSDVEARYGARVASRLRELQVVRMAGEDKRGAE